MLFLGFAAGIPLLLIFSSLSLWLREAGYARSTVTLFSWAALGYSFKFVWAPLVDQLPIPWLTRVLGRRRAWMLLAQFFVILSIVLMALTDPALGENRLLLLAAFAVLLGFSSATQDIVIDAYRIESAEARLQAMMSATYIAGYRVGLLVAGAGALYLSSTFGSTAQQYVYAAWQKTYLLMAATMLVGVVTTLSIPEPKIAPPAAEVANRKHHAQLVLLFVLCAAGLVTTYALTAPLALQLKAVFLSWTHNAVLSGFQVEGLRLLLAVLAAGLIAAAALRCGWVSREVVKHSYIQPIGAFFSRHGVATAGLILLLIGSYRISDIVLGVIANVFYQDIGFSKPEIAQVSKTFGLLMTIAGGLVGGIMVMRFGVMRILFLGALLSCSTNLLFYLLAQTGPSLWLLYLVIGADNSSAGLASAAFVAFLSALTNIRFTAMQFALFTSLMTLLPKLLGGYSGAIVDQMGYSRFFIFTTLIGFPVLVLILIAGRRLHTGAPKPP